MAYNANPDSRTWNQCLGLLAEVFEKWKVGQWAWRCPLADSGIARNRNHWSIYGGRPDQVQVTVTFRHPKDGERSVTVSKFGYPVDNLWAIWKGLDAIRLNEMRGLDDVAREFYAALPAPQVKRDPWEVLGLRPEALPEVVTATYRALANKLHPDKGGDPDAFKELQEAYEAVKAR